MKKIIFTLFSAIVLLSSCGGGSSENSGEGSDNSKSVFIPKDFDFQLFSKPGEVTRLYDMIIDKLGDNIKKVDEISMRVSRPSKDAIIIRENAPDEANIHLSYLYPQDPNKLYTVSYHSGREGWDDGAVKGIKLISGDVETFKLEDEMSDLSALTPAVLEQVVNDAMAKYKDETKYSLQYVNIITIKGNTIEVGVRGTFAANDQKKTSYYKADLTGKAK